MYVEIWKDILGYEFAYQVSNLGNVRSKDRTVLDSRLGFKSLRGKPLRCTQDTQGYTKVTLQDRGRNKVYKVHRLVAEHFLVKVEGKNIINHLDNVRNNNKVENLEWCTAQENTAHMHKQGRNYSASGQENPACKLTDEAVAQILALRGQLSQACIAAQFNVSRTHVGRILRGERRSA